MEHHSSLSDRIKQLVDYFADGKNTVFARLVGTSEANIRGYLAGRMPKFDFIQSALQNLEINYEWLLFGRGEMLPKVEKNKKAPDHLPDINIVIELSTRLGEQSNENKHLHESNIELSAHVKSLNNTIENLKKENDGLKTQIRELKKEGKPYEMPVSSLSLVAEPIPAPIVKKTGENPQITPTEPLPTRLSTPKNL